MARAIKNAFIIVIAPVINSPLIISLTEFVIATPGTKSIITPIIIISIFEPRPKWTQIIARIDVMKAQIILFIKNESFKYDNFSKTRDTRIPIKKLAAKSLTSPPNKTEKKDAAIPPPI